LAINTEEMQKRSRFRNGVIHRGEFPSRAATMDYATYVFGFIRRFDAELIVRLKDAYDTVRTRHWSTAASKLWQKGYRGSIGGMFVLTALGSSKADFESALECFRETNQWLHPADRFTIRELAERAGMSVEQYAGILMSAFAAGAHAQSVPLREDPPSELNTPCRNCPSNCP
jgi:hypothetical protein